MLWHTAFVLLAYHEPADVGYADNQTGLFFSVVLAHSHQEIALGVYRLVGPTLLEVTFQGPCGACIAVYDWHAAMTLTWPWWSLGGSLGRVDLVALPSVGIVVKNSSVERGF